MSLNIVEFFGYNPCDKSKIANQSRSDRFCPFLNNRCVKLIKSEPSGVCTVKLTKSVPVICCPNRLYANEYSILQQIAQDAFGHKIQLINSEQAKNINHDGSYVAVFGKRWGKELRLPKRGGSGSYFVDWVLALIGKTGELQEFIAIEIQSIDTTGNYQKERQAYLAGKNSEGSPAGLNWENVSKRILPQIIFKGHVLRREPLCKKGLFFVCPTPVYNKITERLGGNLLQYTPQPGSLTFRWYNIGEEKSNGKTRDLIMEGQFTTTIDQVATAFTAPQNLPPQGVYELAIKQELNK